MRTFHHLLPLLTLALVCTACAEETDSPSQVKDLRILAVAADPPEILFDRNTGFDSPQVVFSALVADPRGATTTYTWRFCPVESEQACMNFNSLRDSAPAQMRGMLDGLFAQADEGVATLAPQQGVGAFDVPSFPAAWPTDLFSYHLQTSGLGLGNGAWPSAVLSLTDGAGHQVMAQKRMTLNALDLAAFNPELKAAFGITICEAGATAGCLPLRPRVPNRNPVVADVLVARGRSGDLPFAPVTDTIVVRAKETVRLRPILSDSSFETYQSVQSALQDNSLRVEEQKERPAVSWFTTAGMFDNDVTAFEATKTFDNTFTAPDVPPAERGGEVSVWIVVRDLRGGTGWREVRLVVVP